MNHKLFGVKHAEQNLSPLHVELLAAYSSGRVRGLSPSVYASAKITSFSEALLGVLTSGDGSRDGMCTVCECIVGLTRA